MSFCKFWRWNRILPRTWTIFLFLLLFFFLFAFLFLTLPAFGIFLCLLGRHFDSIDVPLKPTFVSKIPCLRFNCSSPHFATVIRSIGRSWINWFTFLKQVESFYLNVCQSIFDSIEHFASRDHFSKNDVLVVKMRLWAK